MDIFNEEVSKKNIEKSEDINSNVISTTKLDVKDKSIFAQKSGQEELQNRMYFSEEMNVHDFGQNMSKESEYENLENSKVKLAVEEIKSTKEATKSMFDGSNAEKLDESSNIIANYKNIKQVNKLSPGTVNAVNDNLYKDKQIEISEGDVNSLRKINSDASAKAQNEIKEQENGRNRDAEEMIQMLSKQVDALHTFLNGHKTKGDSDEYIEVCDATSFLKDKLMEDKNPQEVWKRLERLYDACVVYNSKNRGFRWSIQGKNRQKHINSMLNFLNWNWKSFDVLRSSGVNIVNEESTNHSMSAEESANHSMNVKESANHSMSAEENANHSMNAVECVLADVDIIPCNADFIKGAQQKAAYSDEKISENIKRIEELLKLSPKNLKKKFFGQKNQEDSKNVLSQNNQNELGNIIGRKNQVNKGEDELQITQEQQELLNKQMSVLNFTYGRNLSQQLINSKKSSGSDSKEMMDIKESVLKYEMLLNDGKELDMNADISKLLSAGNVAIRKCANYLKAKNPTTEEGRNRYQLVITNLQRIRSEIRKIELAQSLLQNKEAGYEKIHTAKDLFVFADSYQRQHDTVIDNLTKQDKIAAKSLTLRDFQLQVGKANRGMIRFKNGKLKQIDNSAFAQSNIGQMGSILFGTDEERTVENRQMRERLQELAFERIPKETTEIRRGISERLGLDKGQSTAFPLDRQTLVSVLKNIDLFGTKVCDFMIDSGKNVVDEKGKTELHRQLKIRPNLLKAYRNSEGENEIEVIENIIADAKKAGLKNVSLNEHQKYQIANGSLMRVVEEIYDSYNKVSAYASNIGGEFKQKTIIPEDDKKIIAALALAKVAAENQTDYELRSLELENYIRSTAEKGLEDEQNKIVQDAFKIEIPMLAQGGSAGLRTAVNKKISSFSKWQNVRAFEKLKETVKYMEDIFTAISEISMIHENIMKEGVDENQRADLIAHAEIIQRLVTKENMKEMEKVVNQLENTRYKVGFQDLKALVNSKYNFVEAQKKFLDSVREKQDEKNVEGNNVAINKDKNEVIDKDSKMSEKNKPAGDADFYSENDKIVSLKGTEKKIVAFLRNEVSPSVLIKAPLDENAKVIEQLKNDLIEFPIGVAYSVEKNIAGTKFSIVQKEDNSLHVIFKNRAIPLHKKAMQIVSSIEDDMVSNIPLYGKEAVKGILDSTNVSEDNIGMLVRSRNLCIKYLASVSGKHQDFFANVPSEMLRTMVDDVYENRSDIKEQIEKVAEIEKTVYINSSENLELVKHLNKLDKKDVSVHFEEKKNEATDDKKWSQEESDFLNLIADLIYPGNTWEADEKVKNPNENIVNILANNGVTIARMIYQPKFVEQVIEKLPFDDEQKKNLVKFFYDFLENDAVKQIKGKEEPNFVPNALSLFLKGGKISLMIRGAYNLTGKYDEAQKLSANKNLEEKDIEVDEESEKTLKEEIDDAIKETQNTINEKVEELISHIQEMINTSVSEVFSAEKQVENQENQNPTANMSKTEREKFEIKQLNKILEDSAKGDEGQGAFVKNVMKNYFKNVSIEDKRAMIASSIRNSKPDSDVGSLLGGLLKGAGPLLQKMLQGMPVVSMPNELKSAVEDMRSNLAPIPQKIVEAQMQNIVDRSNGKITKITVKKSLGAASVGQTFLCVLEGPGYNEGGKEVVVKLLRPDVRNRMMREKNIMLECAKMTDQATALKAGEQNQSQNKIGGMEGTYIGQLERIEEELDLTIEAKNVQKGTMYDRGFSSVKAMKMEDSVEATSNALVLEKAEGETVDKYLKRIEQMQKDILIKFVKKNEDASKAQQDDKALDGANKVKTDEKALDDVNKVKTDDKALDDVNKVKTDDKALEDVNNEHIDINENNIFDYINSVKALTKELESMKKRQQYLLNMSESWITEGIFGEGFYHGDLHAGNIMINDNNVTLIDFGNATTLTDSQKNKITKMMMAASVGDAKIFEEGFNALLTDSAREKYEEVKEAVMADFSKILKLGNKTASGQRIAVALLKALGHGVELPASVYNFSQSQLRLQNTIDEMNQQIENLKSTLLKLSQATSDDSAHINPFVVALAGNKETAYSKGGEKQEAALSANMKLFDMQEKQNGGLVDKNRFEVLLKYGKNSYTIAESLSMPKHSNQYLLANQLSELNYLTEIKKFSLNLLDTKTCLLSIDNADKLCTSIKNSSNSQEYDKVLRELGNYYSLLKIKSKGLSPDKSDEEVVSKFINENITLINAVQEIFVQLQNNAKFRLYTNINEYSDLAKKSDANAQREKKENEIYNRVYEVAWEYRTSQEQLKRDNIMGPEADLKPLISPFAQMRKAIGNIHDFAGGQNKAQSLISFYSKLAENGSFEGEAVGEMQRIIDQMAENAAAYKNALAEVLGNPDNNESITEIQKLAQYKEKRQKLEQFELKHEELTNRFIDLQHESYEKVADNFEESVSPVIEKLGDELDDFLGVMANVLSTNIKSTVRKFGRINAIRYRNEMNAG